MICLPQTPLFPSQLKKKTLKYFVMNRMSKKNRFALLKLTSTMRRTHNAEFLEWGTYRLFLASFLLLAQLRKRKADVQQVISFFFLLAHWWKLENASISGFLLVTHMFKKAQEPPHRKGSCLFWDPENMQQQKQKQAKDD